MTYIRKSVFGTSKLVLKNGSFVLTHENNKKVYPVNSVNVLKVTATFVVIEDEFGGKLTFNAA